MNQSGTANQYRALLSQEGNVWLIEAEDLQGVRSFGRTVTEAIRNIREAIAAAEDLDSWDDLELEYRFDDSFLSAAVGRFARAARAEEQASAERDEALAAAIESLRTRGMSYRDIGAIVGLSHQRVAQLDSQARV